jgi:predicted ATPase
MLEAFRFSNWKSFQSAEVHLASLTALIGANASGKSNAIEALALLSWMSSGHQLSSLAMAMRDGPLPVRGNLADLLHMDESNSSIELGCDVTDGDGRELSLHIEIAMGNRGPYIVAEELWAVHLDTTAPLYRATKSKDDIYGLDIAYNNFARGGKKPKIRGHCLQPAFTQLRSEASFAQHHSRSRRTVPLACTIVSQSLNDVLILDPVPSRMRTYWPISDARMNPDASNVSSVIYSFGDKESMEALDIIKALPEQQIKAMKFLETPRSEVMISLKERFGRRSLWRDAAVLSDGTLRALAVAAALLSVAEGSTVCVEELDNGIHPPRVAGLIASLVKIAERRGLRVLISTHNPALLDAIPLEWLPNVTVCFRDRNNGDSRLSELGELPGAASLLAQGSLGELVSRGLLEREIDSDDASAREQNAARWLKQIKATL